MQGRRSIALPTTKALDRFPVQGFLFLGGHSKFNLGLYQHLGRFYQQAKKKPLFLGAKSVEMGGIEPPTKR